MNKQEKSQQAIEDKNYVSILQDENASARAKEFAFNQLYSRHHKNVGHFFKVRLNNEDDAEDLKMITFEKVHANIGKYNDQFAFSTWLYNIAKNTYIDHLRRESDDTPVFSISEHEGNEDAVPFQIKSDFLNPEQELLRDERVAEVRDAIDSIENEFIRELMTERFINDISFEEIAEKLGIENNSTLRVNILRGKEILKEALSSSNPFA